MMSDYMGCNNHGNGLEAVTVCIGYGDFLAITAPINHRFFDRWIVVTSPDDEETREVCRRLGIYYLLTEEHRRAGFNKGRAVDRALHLCSANTWRLHLDADMVLPNGFRHYVQSADLDPRCIYGCDRVMVKTYEDWKKLEKRNHFQHDYHYRVNFPKGFDIGTRWATESTGYVPLGCFQLWHAQAELHKGTRIRPYPSRHNDAARADIQHGLQWDRRNRHILPEIIALHLESKNGLPLGVNWKGRKSPRFGPAKTCK